MGDKRKKFLTELEKLCNIYNDYIEEYKNSRLDVYIGDNVINIDLVNNGEVVDKFGLAFNNRERNCYKYISLFIFKILFAGKIIYSKDNMFFDDIENMSLNIKVNNKMMLDEFINMMFIENDIDNNRIRNKIDRMRCGNNMNQRVELTKKLLKRV